MASTIKPTNRVWIELEPPRDAEHAKEVAKLANQMFARLRGATVDIAEALVKAVIDSPYLQF